MKISYKIKDWLETSKQEAELENAKKMKSDCQENEKKNCYKLILEKINSMESIMVKNEMDVERSQNLPFSVKNNTSEIKRMGSNLKRKSGCACSKQRCSNYKCGCLKKNLFCLNCNCKGCENSLKSKEHQAENFSLIDALHFRKKVIDFYNSEFIIFLQKQHIAEKSNSANREKADLVGHFENSGIKQESNEESTILGIDSLAPMEKMMINNGNHQKNPLHDDHSMMQDCGETLVKTEFNEKMVKKRAPPAFFQIKNLNSLKYI